MSCPKSILGKHLWSPEGKCILCGASQQESSGDEKVSETVTVKYRLDSEGNITPEEFKFADEIIGKLVRNTPVEHQVPFILWRLRSTKGVCKIRDEQGRIRVLPRIIVKAMQEAGRKIEIIKCARNLRELGYY